MVIKLQKYNAEFAMDEITKSENSPHFLILQRIYFLNFKQFKHKYV